MKKIICLLLCAFALLLLGGCVAEKQGGNNETVVYPDAHTAETVNGYKTEPETEKENLYYANRSSKKFHLAECTYATSIKAENLYKTTNRDGLIDDGYSPCKACKP